MDKVKHMRRTPAQMKADLKKASKRFWQGASPTEVAGELGITASNLSKMAKRFHMDIARSYRFEKWSKERIATACQTPQEGQ